MEIIMANEKIEFDVIEEERAVQEADNWFEQKIFGEITEEIYQRGSFSVAVIHAYADNKLYEGVGFSKARQEVSAARYDSDRGKTVARGRAIHDLFSEYKRAQKR
jgi:hypothetical protein